MAFDEGLAHRIREMLIDQQGLTEKKMFGGIAFMVHGNMACGVTGEEMMVRVGADNYDAALTEADVRPFDMSGKKMKGWVLAGSAALDSDEALAGWVKRGVDFALSLPSK